MRGPSITEGILPTTKGSWASWVLHTNVYGTKSWLATALLGRCKPSSLHFKTTGHLESTATLNLAASMPSWGDPFDGSASNGDLGSLNYSDSEETTRGEIQLNRKCFMSGLV